MAITRARPTAPDPSSMVLIGVALGVLVLASALQPTSVTLVVVGLLAAVAVALQPSVGIAILLSTLLVTYGQTAVPGQTRLGAIIAGGAGFLTINNMLGMLLAVLMMYRIYQEHDWSFLKSRQVQILLLATAILVLSNLLNFGVQEKMVELGLGLAGQDPRRLLISRALLLVLLVFFVRKPWEVRLLWAVFLVLVLASAFNGLTEALRGRGFGPYVAGYRAGGPSSLIWATANPNRLAAFCTVTLAFIWEYHQGGRRWRDYLMTATVLLLIVTVFMTASRGGVIGLGSAILLIFARRRQRLRGLPYLIVVSIVAIFLLAQFIPQDTIERLANIPGITAAPDAVGSGSIQRRQYSLVIAMRLVAENPIIGIGIGNWEYFRFVIDPVRTSNPPHNSYLLMLSEGGIVTLILYLLVFYITLRQLSDLETNPDKLRQIQADGLGWVLGGLRIAIPAFMVFSMFGDLWENVLFYLLIGTSVVLVRRYGTPGRTFALR